MPARQSCIPPLPAGDRPSSGLHARRCPPAGRWKALAVLLLATSAPAHAGDRLAATGGLMAIEGAAGGGLSPWALIAGLGTDRQVGGSAMCTRVDPGDFTLTSCGVAVGLRDRVEVSFARQHFSLGQTVPGQSIDQDIVGVKVRVLGDAVFDQDRWWPQLAVGAQYKRNRDADFVPALLGARDGSDIDWYVSATKLWLAGPWQRQWIGNLTLRATRANQFGILGFGGDRNDSYRIQPEITLGAFVTDEVAMGIEYRAKPDNLSVFAEGDAWDAWISVIPDKHWSVTAAYVDLGRIADRVGQRGWYLSLQLSY